jgi:hypothetical protein
MTDQLSGCEADKVLDAPLKTIVGCLAEVMPKGPVQTALYWVAGLCILAAPFIYKYYLGVLAQGAAPEGSIERQDYERLRASLAGDNLAARLYAKWLTAFLDGVERFFGDAGTEGQRAFGLKKPAPLWTAPAFDRCLLLAFIYPIVTIFVVWAISGHVGPAEAALGLKPDMSGWARGLSAGAIGLLCLAFWRAFRAEGRKSLVWGAFATAVSVGAAVSAGDVATSVATVVAVPIAIAIAFAGVGFVAGAGDVAGAVAFAVARAIAVALTGAGVVAGAVAGCATVVGAFAVAFAIKYGRQNVFLLFFLPAMILTCLGAADLLSPLERWNIAGPLLLFLGLLTLLNAPSDWASLGLTRALLRRGLELGGWWPYLLALIDACLAAVIIALLALIMVIGVQAFDELAAHGGGEKAMVLPLPALFDGIAKNPGAPEYWWAYVLLLSTMIPSLVNLAISGMALTRGIPGLGRLLLRWIPEGRDVPDYRRPLADACPNRSNVCGRFRWHRGAGVPRLGPHFPCHAMDWPRPARHSPRGCHF